jgi:DNA repair protein RecN (Recombination protein N)
MLTSLSIRDIVIIEKLYLSFERGVSVLTGETGAGKSILLDALGLALGARGDSSLVRSGQPKGSVSVAFNVPRDHKSVSLLADHDIDATDELIFRRVQNADGTSKAFINEQQVTLQLLRSVATHLVELHGQHADRALVDVAEHRRLVDAFGNLDTQVTKLDHLHNAMRTAEATLVEQRERLDRAAAEREFLENAAKELKELNPEPLEEQRLAEARQLMMQSEQYLTALEDLENALAGDGAFEAKVNAALRKLERRKDGAAGRLDAVCEAADRTLREISETNRSIADARARFAFHSGDLEKSEERLFALRAAGRKYKCQVDELANVRARFEADLTAIVDGGATLGKLEKAFADAQATYDEAADALSAARRKAAKALDKAVQNELPALKLERARFETQIETDASKRSSHGIDRAEFRVAANPGTPLQPLMKVASGGELARFMLALKVVLAAKGSAPVLIFDEIDTGVGGAVADAIGKRLMKLGTTLQVLTVTHSPQVAARADQHFLISKMEDVGKKRVVTRVAPLSKDSRREELARMLSGSIVTQQARAQADQLLADGSG